VSGFVNNLAIFNARKTVRLHRFLSKLQVEVKFDWQTRLRANPIWVLIVLS